MMAPMRKARKLSINYLQLCSIWSVSYVLFSFSFQRIASFPVAVCSFIEFSPLESRLETFLISFKKKFEKKTIANFKTCIISPGFSIIVRTAR